MVFQSYIEVQSKNEIIIINSINSIIIIIINCILSRSSMYVYV